jgi:2-hydroxy-3-keto-5-methylthiopentenyl-1-phosphate phosphatase
MMDSVSTPYDQCIKKLLENIKLDPYFKEFYEWARANNVPVVVLSSGMVPIIRALLIHLVGKDAEDIQVSLIEAIPFQQVSRLRHASTFCVFNAYVLSLYPYFIFSSKQ